MDYGTGKYQYELVEGWAKLPEGWSFVDVAGITIDSQDRVIILNRSAHPIIVLDCDGNLVNTWGEGIFNRAHGSCIGPDGSVYCADDGNHTVSQFTPDGKLLLQLGDKGKPSNTGYVRKSNTLESLDTIKGGPPFNRPTDVSLSPGGELYISDGYGNARVHKFTPDGRLMFSWGEPGTDSGQLRLPHGIWADKQDRVWVADRENNRIQIFDNRGKFLTQWTGFLRPTDIVMDKDEVVYISELTRRISILDSSGQVLARWGCEVKDPATDLFVGPHTAAVDSRGDLYIGDVAMTIGKVDRGARTIQKFARRS